MSPQLYAPVFLYSVILMTIFVGQTAGNSYALIKSNKNNFFIALLVCVVFALWLGNRPVAMEFGDTFNYNHKYELIQYGHEVNINEGEGLFAFLMIYCAERYEVNIFFTLIDILYFGFTLWACKRFAPNNPFAMLLFVMGAFSFYTYGVNGIRNGLACSIILVAISYLNENKRDLIIAGILSLAAFNIHRSTVLPTLMAFGSYFFLRSGFKWSVIFWLFSILISLTLGSFVENIFTSLGFDDRMTKYMSSEFDEEFENTGFRWDFLLYSAMPIILGYVIVITKGIQDKTYLLLLNTYTLSNAFWVMMIRANFSNRFAYLSWFMYPIVLGYPLLRLNVWGADQGRRLRLIMYAQVGFTWFMETFIWK